MHLAQTGEKQGVIDIANGGILWILAIAILGIVAVQSVIYIFAVRRNAAAADMTPKEVATAVRAGAVTSIGPSLAVVLVAVSLLPLFGTPAVLVRIGLIGSAATEVASATAAADSMGADLGGEGWNADVFTVALLAMSLSGAGWMLCTLILTPVLGKGTRKMERVNPALMAIVPTAALLAAFSTLGMQQLQNSGTHVLALGVSAVVMAACLFIAQKLNHKWLREWGLGFAIVGGLIAAGVATG